MRVDLHIHTTASDGCWSPKQVVSHVLKTGIGLFAVTDHESVANVGQTQILAREAGLGFLTGVEASSSFDGRVAHILGYGIDPHDTMLRELLESNYALLSGHNDEAIRQLAVVGFPVNLKEYARYERNPDRGGWKSLDYLVELGLCADVDDFFQRIVPKIDVPMPHFPHPTEVAEVIRVAGGVSILAHPGMLMRDGDAVEDILLLALDFKISGLECYSSYHDPAFIESCVDFCGQNGLLITGGSDCHGGFVGRPLGIPVVDISKLDLGELAQLL
jgi:predicted metal-dependent phosphoesterase TrpH